MSSLKWVFFFILDIPQSSVKGFIKKWKHLASVVTIYWCTKYTKSPMPKKSYNLLKPMGHHSLLMILDFDPMFCVSELVIIHFNLCCDVWIHVPWHKLSSEQSHIYNLM